MPDRVAVQDCFVPSGFSGFRMFLLYFILKKYVVHTTWGVVQGRLCARLCAGLCARLCAELVRSCAHSAGRLCRTFCAGVVRRGCAHVTWHNPPAQAKMVVRAARHNLPGYVKIHVSARHNVF